MNEARALVLKATDPDATLAERHEAFGGLVRMFQDMAYACAYAVLGDLCLAEDAAQEAFVTAWRKLGQLRQPEAFAGWLRRIVLTECNRMTRGKRPRTVPLEDDGACAAPASDGPLAALERDELTKTVLAAVRSLPEKERMAVVLFYVREHSQADIGAFLEVPLTTVAKRLHSARARLRGMLTDGLRERLAARRPSRGRGFAERVEAGIYDEYVGRYRFEQRPELVVTIRREGDRLLSEAAGQTNELYAYDGSEARLLAREFDGAGRFVRDARGRVSHLVYYEFGREMGTARKIC